MNRMNNNGRAGNTPTQNVANQGDLMQRIQELSLVRTELELYLDTHPTCKTALDSTTRLWQHFSASWRSTITLMAPSWQQILWIPSVGAGQRLPGPGITVK